MKSRNGIAALIYRFILLIICITGLILMTGFSAGKDGSEIFCYYTVQSNILICILYLFLCIRGALDYKRGKCTACYYPRIKAGAVLCIFATFLIFHFVLLPQMVSYKAIFNAFSLASLFVHYAVPLMTVADWLIFDARLTIRPTDPLKWLFIPYGYFAEVMLRAIFGPILSNGSKYPYFFIDVDLFGWLSVSRYLAVLTILFICLGYLILLSDRIIAAVGASVRGITEKRSEENRKGAF